VGVWEFLMRAFLGGWGTQNPSCGLDWEKNRCVRMGIGQIDCFFIGCRHFGGSAKC
jgi:hypothetical protein